MDGPFIQILSCYLYTWFCKIPKFHGFLNFKNCKQLWSVENSWDHDRLQFTLPYFFFIWYIGHQSPWVSSEFWYSHHLLLALLDFFGHLGMLQTKEISKKKQPTLKNYVKRTILIALEDAVGQEPSGYFVGGLVDATADAPLNRMMYKNLPKTSPHC